MREEELEGNLEEVKERKVILKVKWWQSFVLLYLKIADIFLCSSSLRFWLAGCSYRAEEQEGGKGYNWNFNVRPDAFSTNPRFDGPKAMVDPLGI